MTMSLATPDKTVQTLQTSLQAKAKSLTRKELSEALDDMGLQ